MKPLLLSLLLFAARAFAETVPVTLSWDANKEPDLDHYELQIGTSPGVYNITYPISEITDTIDLPINVMQYAVVVAVNTSGLKSEPSKELAFQVFKPGEGHAPAAPTGLHKTTIAVTLQSSPDLRVWCNESVTLFHVDGPQMFWRIAIR